MARPVIFINQTRCAECDKEMEPRKYKKPFKKLCPECKSKNLIKMGGCDSCQDCFWSACPVA